MTKYSVLYSLCIKCCHLLKEKKTKHCRDNLIKNKSLEFLQLVQLSANVLCSGLPGLVTCETVMHVTKSYVCDCIIHCTSCTIHPNLSCNYNVVRLTFSDLFIVQTHIKKETARERHKVTIRSGGYVREVNVYRLFNSKHLLRNVYSHNLVTPNERHL